MKPEDAQAALDDVQFRTEQSRGEYLRYGYSSGQLLVSALVLFISFASFDLPNPWGGAVLFPAVALLVTQLVVYLRRAPVRMPLGSRAALLSAAAGAALVGLFTVLSDAAEAAGVPVPHTIAGAVLSAVGLLVAYRVREGKRRGGE
ncbi:hypothetical protein [Streptomyces sp. TLI_185]|uniref:hypothetical protein n=1 Tax=Streptomyces sp. TLI_185 TaxID=2485151 RepID=UPI000F4F9062|nr:hypothetical protein [Streptomyces sp. TLI_185]RPF34490.1 hypothetical protein EDD92_4445 [Streptomyces sp. TLI_185]